MRTLIETQSKQIKKELKKDKQINTIRGVMLSTSSVVISDYVVSNITT